MQSYVLLLCAALWHALGLGTVGMRGRIVHGLTGVAILVGVLTGRAGYVGLLAGLGTVLGVRHGGRWLLDGGAFLLAEWVGRLWRWFAPWAVDLLRDMVIVVAGVFSPPRTYEAAPVELSEPVSVRGETAQVVMPHGDRWGMLGPADTAGDTEEWPALVSVETYWDWIATAVKKCGGYNAAAREAAARFGVSRSKFARNLRALKEEAA